MANKDRLCWNCPRALRASAHNWWHQRAQPASAAELVDSAGETGSLHYGGGWFHLENRGGRIIHEGWRSNQRYLFILGIPIISLFSFSREKNLGVVFTVLDLLGASLPARCFLPSITMSLSFIHYGLTSVQDLKIWITSPVIVGSMVTH